VRREENPLYYELLCAFERLTGCPVLVNTSFNVRGEPIVCTPEQAYTCFMRTEMDYLVLGDFILDKRQQGEFVEARTWQEEFQLD
jgi:carbamoyltransferase